MRTRVGVLLVALLSGLIAGPRAGFAEPPVEPTETGETGLLTIPTTRTLAPKQFSLGFAYRTEIGNEGVFERSIRQQRDTSVTKYQFTAGVGLYEGLEVSLQIPYVAFQNEVQAGDTGTAESSDANKIGDLRLTPKYRLFREGDSPMPFSFAVEGSLQLPTGSDQLPAQLERNTAFNGDKVGGEVIAIVDRKLFKLPSGAPATATLNIGGLFPSKPNVFRLDRQTEPVFSQLRRKGFPNSGVKTAVFEYGAAVDLPLWVHRLGTFASTIEYRGNMGTIEEVDSYQALLIGLRVVLANGLAARFGVDFGLSNSQSNYNLLTGITYSGPQAPPAPPAVPQETIVYGGRAIPVETVELSDVNFAFDKGTLTDVGLSRTYLIAQKLKDGKNVKVVIEDRSDYIGTEDQSKKLGMQRAETVKAELVHLGIDPASISTVSFGGERPLGDKQTPWARAVSRRAEFVVVSGLTVTSRTTTQ